MASPGRLRSRPTPLCRPLELTIGCSLILSLLGGSPLRAQDAGGSNRGGTISLECRLASGPWQPCQMQVEQMGAHWWLLIAGQRLEFRHDGRGQVRMQRGRETWRQVNSSWGEDASLCWDGVCARGDIPLD